MQSWEEHLVRWEGAGLVDAETGARVRTFEAAEEKPASHRWQVVIALILGGILLGAGVLLFVAAHWDEVSPMERLALVAGVFALLHLGGVLSAERFPAMATTLHAVGTVGAGAAIALVGQIFNMQEHWPAAVMLWALCAGAGWYFLRDQFQQTWFLLLAPAWVVCEWQFRANVYRGSEVYLGRILAVLAAVYLTAFLRSQKRAVWGILFTVGGVALMVVTPMLADGWARWAWAGRDHPMLPWDLRAVAMALIALILAVGAWWERRSLPPAVVVLAMSFALPWLQARVRYDWGHGAYDGNEPSVLAYALVAGVALFLAWWGVRERSRALVNYGIGMFAVTVAWFYFSSLMDKLGRSLGLIGLGVVFLAGGWLLERGRRKLMAQMREEVAA